MRWWNAKHPNAYAQTLADGRLPVADFEHLDADTMHMEDVMLRVRLAAGLPLSGLDEAGRAGAERARADGLLDADAYAAGRAVLTLRGRLLADAVVRDLLP